MANFLGDLSNYIGTASLWATSTGVSTNANAQGASVDIGPTVSPIVSAVLVVGNVAGTTPTGDFKVQESTDGTTYTDVTGGAFTQVTTSSAVQVLAFQPTKRYLRTTGTVAGTNPVLEATTLVIAPRRLVPANDGGFDQTAAPAN